MGARVFCGVQLQLDLQETGRSQSVGFCSWNKSSLQALADWVFIGLRPPTTFGDEDLGTPASSAH